MNVNDLSSVRGDENRVVGGQLENPFKNLSQFSKILSLAITSFGLVCIIFDQSGSLFAMNPGFSVSHFWNIFTAGFYDNNVISLVFNCLFILLGSKFLEPLWGPEEIIKFLLVVNIFCGTISMIVLLFLGNVFGEIYLYEASWNGSSFLLASFLVILKQLVPERELKLLGGISVRAKHLPLLFVLLRTFFLFLEMATQSYAYVLFSIMGSWIYLRFYQKHGSSANISTSPGIKNGNSCGDRNDGFAFHTFFPGPLQPPIKVVGNMLFSFFVLIRLCNGREDFERLPEHHLGQPVNISLTGNANDAERRRNIALGALEKRLAHITNDANINEKDLNKKKSTVDGINNNVVVDLESGLENKQNPS